MEGPIRPRSGCRDAAGFTLVEILVVILVFALLAAIAIPAYFSQVAKAEDARAQEQAQAAALALEAWAVDSSGDFRDATVDDLEEIEPTLAAADLQLLALGEDAYVVRARSSERRFEIQRNSDGGRTLSCRPKASGGCGPGGSWG